MLGAEQKGANLTNFCQRIFLKVPELGQKSFPHGLQQRYHSPGDASARGDAKLQRPSVVAFVPHMASGFLSFQTTNRPRRITLC